MKRLGGRLLTVFLILGSFYTARPSVAAGEGGHVVFVTIDGLRADAVKGDTTPTLWQLLGESEYSLDAKTVLPSRTLPAHLSLVSGVSPQRHSVTWNRYRPEVGTVETDTLFLRFEREGLHTALFAGKRKLAHLAAPERIHHHEAWRARSDAEVMDRALAYLERERPAFTLIHLPRVDRVGHAWGWMGGRQLRAVGEADAQVARLVATLRRLRAEERWTLLITADHGGRGSRHGSAREEDVTIPWIVWGDGVTAGEIPPPTLLDAYRLAVDTLER